MATKRTMVEEQAAQAEERAVPAGTETAENAGSSEPSAAGAAEEERHDEQAAESAETAAPDPEKDVAAPAQEAAELLSLSALAARRRVPSWQQAALCRYMGWADGKMLTEEAYQTALNSLAQRHMGGGRKR